MLGERECSKLKSLWAWLALVLFLAAGVAGCGNNPRQEGVPSSPNRERVRVVATFYPVAYFARQVGGDRVEVTTLIPTGVEPHEWEPSPRQVLALKQADVFVYNGAGLEPWATRLVEGAGNRELVVVEASKGLELLTFEAEPGQAGTESGMAREHEHEGLDPHVWLDPVYAQEQVRRILEGFTAADPAGATAYRSNAERLIDRLQRLDAKYRSELAGVAGKKVFTSHAAFSYLFRRYHLEQVPLMGISPEAEPNPAQMARLVRLAREDGARYIFFESLASPRVARTLAAEVGAQVLVLNPIEGLTPEEASRGEDYFTLMEQNLANLKRALEEVK